MTVPALINGRLEITDRDILERVPADYRRFLRQSNGMILFDGGLHLRGAVVSPEWHSLREVWLGDHALSALFPAIMESDVPFAQDCMGDQFLLRDGKVVHLSAETGELESLDIDFDEFLDGAMSDPVGFLSLEPLLQFAHEGGTLEPGRLLNAYPPFCMEQSANGVALSSVPMFERITFLADLARQLRDLPPGMDIDFRVVE